MNDESNTVNHMYVQEVESNYSYFRSVPNYDLGNENMTKLNNTDIFYDNINNNLSYDNIPDNFEQREYDLGNDNGYIQTFVEEELNNDNNNNTDTNNNHIYNIASS